MNNEMNDLNKILRQELGNRILVVDGAMGTSLQDLDLTDADFGGEELQGCNEHLNLTRPNVIAGIHEEFLRSGADIVETNTFGGTALVLSEYGLQDKAFAINEAGARLAREAAALVSEEDGKRRFVAGAMGPTTKAISVTGGITFDELVETFRGQASGLLAGGVDYFLIETCQDTRNVKACVFGIQAAMEEAGVSLPIAISVTIEVMGTMLAGQTVEAVYASLAHFDLLYLGLNCATGPGEMTDHVRRLAAISHFPLSCVPNAGLPDEDGQYLETPAMVAQVLKGFAEQGWLNVIGGCCGTRPAHTKAMREIVGSMKPRPLRERKKASLLSGVDLVRVEEAQIPYIVGERTNVIGSRKFKRLISSGEIEQAAELARSQERSGAKVIDICLSDSERDEIEDVHAFYTEIVKKVRAPIMIDSTSADAIDVALRYCQGKAIINSVNLEDGLERFELVVPLARKYGAALVVGCIDEDPEQGMAVTRDRKLAIAARSHRILTEDFDFPEEDIYFDPLVFPCATGDENYIGSATETVAGIRLIKDRFPHCKTILGISNVSFGLPTAGREVLNSVYLHHCVEAGLDLAIANVVKCEKISNIPKDEVELCERLLWTGDDDAIAAFAAHFRKKKGVTKTEPAENLTVDEKIAQCILHGTKEGLTDALATKMKDTPPLDIINGPLMAGMSEVGRLFNKNQLIVAEVLQSAEAMKAAVAYLEPFMDKSDSSGRGSLLLATVKGDVHDIGKNLVDIIFTNNGFKVVNLGIKVPPEKLIEAVEEHEPDMIGLSGLLVKSAQQMVTTAAALKEAGITVPILVGGAALTERFTRTRIAKAYGHPVLYCKDAMSGLDCGQALMDPERRESVIAAAQADEAEETEVEEVKVEVTTKRSDAVEFVTPPDPPDFDRHIVTSTPPEQIWRYLNQAMLFTKNLGFKGSFSKALERGDDKAVELNEMLETVKALYKDVCKPKAVFQYFRAAGEGNTISLYDKDGGFLCAMDFPRQPHDEHLCLADYLLPDSAEGPQDNLCLFVTTAGAGVMDLAHQLKEDGEYLKSHTLQALAMGTAEAYAEHIHAHIRAAWGFPEAPDMSLRDCFAARYHGIRYSFGYPACPDMEGQSVIWQLLKPEEIGCKLTDGFMMEPEASVSALVFHHPQARYFTTDPKLSRTV